MRKLRVFVLLLPMLLLIGALILDAAYASPTTVSLWPSDDTYIWDGRSTTIYGSALDLQIENGGLGFIQEILVRFDLSSIPSGATIESTTLKLYFFRAWSPYTTVYAYRITSTWSEGSVTWSTRPGLESTATDSLYISTTGWKTWSVTADVQDFVSGTKTNYGWQLKANANIGDTDARSKEYPDTTYDPVLEVTYKAPTTITVDCDPDNVEPGGSTTISGQLTSDGSGLSGKSVDLYYAPADSATGDPTDSWTPITTVTTGTGGAYSHTWYPPGEYCDYWAVKATFAGDSDYEGSEAKTGVALNPNLHIIPETPLGAMAALASMTLILAAVMLYKRKT